MIFDRLKSMADQMQSGESRVLNTVTMGSSDWSVAQYGIVEYLRKHPWWRVLVGTLGILCGLLFVISFLGFKIPGIAFSFVFIAVAPWLLWVATVSGNRFQLVFPTAQAQKERQLAEKQFEESQTPDLALKLDLKRLNEYYIINQAQARSSFRWALFSMFIGFGTIVVGIWMFYFGNHPDKFMAGLSTAAGCVLNLVSGLFLHLHSKTQDRSLFYYEQLARLQKVSLAINLVDAHEDATTRANARNVVIAELVSASKTPQIRSKPIKISA
jgi:hypothetical protein